MKVLLEPNRTKDHCYRVTAQAAQILHEAGAKVFVAEPEAKECLPDFVELLKGDLSEFSAVVAFGGDGTLLSAAHRAADFGVPLVGVNLGTVGFLTEVEPKDIGLLVRLTTGAYSLEERMMLSILLYRGDKVIYETNALNDCIVSRGGTPRSIPLVLQSDGKTLKTLLGDGVIVATPTGTTAYSLSAGGPIVEPMAESITITPICAHALYAKAFVLRPERVVSILIGPMEGKEAWLSGDGVESVPLCSGDRIVVHRSRLTTRIVKFGNDNFYDILKEKLMDRSEKK
ncbi:MAG TPA: NAD(+)/NADH kinase [Clostridiales bacterium]|nr:NAD(+)/NADH kinase [Clostridiales bacterium]